MGRKRSRITVTVQDMEVEPWEEPGPWPGADKLASGEPRQEGRVPPSAALVAAGGGFGGGPAAHIDTEKRPPPPPPPPGQQPGELQAACAAELARGWRPPAADVAAALCRLALAALLQDRLTPPVLAHTKLTDLLGVAGGWADGGPAGRARVEGRRVARLPAGPERDAAEAALYAPGWAGEPWMETGDLAGGFRQLVHFPQFRLGVSRSGRLAAGAAVAKVCRAPAGWRVARAPELLAAGLRRGGARQPRQNYYHGQAGWSMQEWSGVRWAWFVTEDWEMGPAGALQAVDRPPWAGAVHAGLSEGQLPCANPARLRSQLPTGGFGGVVFVKE